MTRTTFQGTIVGKLLYNTYSPSRCIAKETTVTPAVKTRGPGGNREVASAATLCHRMSPRFSYSTSIVKRTHIRPALQLSGTVKVTEVEGGASHLQERVSYLI